MEYCPDAGLVVTTMQPLGGVVLEAANARGMKAKNASLLNILNYSMVYNELLVFLMAVIVPLSSFEPS